MMHGVLCATTASLHKQLVLMIVITHNGTNSNLHASKKSTTSNNYSHLNHSNQTNNDNTY